ncbi:hypothetical protein [Parapedobacter sp. 10938]|uniref:hypothetical protein n=1 Tax=Parapedobacter flavus TaxID=3110225 RepID=UPI002DBACE5B|nr:hypothetical protein [Parapedobacter sp. 10938]MEC3881032.1 hypothetical protein [Parapedobacter sp. 10938]
MKLKTLIIALVSIPALNFAAGSANGAVIRPAKQTVEAAKATDKLILVISQSHEGMAAHILENQHTSRFLDAHFIIEQQTNPSEQDLYLIYNQQQELVHRVANEPYPYELAVKIKCALNPDKQYYTLLARFDNGDRSAALLENLIMGSADAGDRENAPRLMQAYLHTQASPMTPAAIRLLAKHTNTSNDPGFAVLLNDMATADQVLGAGKTAEKVASIIFDEAFAPYLNEKNVDLEALSAQVKLTYPHDKLAHLIDGMAIQLMEIREDWDGLKAAIPTYLRTHGHQLSKAMRDYYIWLSENS